MRARVIHAQAWRHARGQHDPNTQLRSKKLKMACDMTPEAGHLLKSAMRELMLSVRSYTKILKVARTIADLAGAAAIEPAHLAEAIQYRSLDRQLWA